MNLYFICETNKKTGVQDLIDCSFREKEAADEIARVLNTLRDQFEYEAFAVPIGGCGDCNVCKCNVETLSKGETG
jgi:hypothetical protein